jgi:glutathione S-transferase
MIDVYYWPTPNGHKITMFLEETGMDYRLVPIDPSRVRSEGRIQQNPVVNDESRKILFGQTAQSLLSNT